MQMPKKMKEQMEGGLGAGASAAGGGGGGRAGGGAGGRPGGGGGGGARSGRASQVKNRSPAPVQISAEQILREAHEFREAEFVKPPQQAIVDAEELASYRLRKRKEFEDVVRRQRLSIGTWMKYAAWEASQKEFDRARSVWERCLDVDHRNEAVWLKYAEMEMKNRFVNHARNIWDRAVTLMPRVDQFWYKYAYMEEMLGNVAAARQIFERWMEWEPDHNAWTSYVKLELRHKNIARARDILQRFVVCHNEVDSYLRLAKFEEKHGNPAAARVAFERATKELGADAHDPALFIAFADFEVRNKEIERARAIYKYALDNIPKHRAEELYRLYTAFEKQHGDRAGVEDVVLSKKRFQYEAELKANPFNYDVWFDYVRLEETTGLDSATAAAAAAPRIREVYERAIAQVPPKQEKKYWKRYIYLWINYALYEELEAKDADRAAAVYDKCLSIVPHAKFTFPTVWMHRAQIEIRRKRLDAARQILGRAIGQCPKETIFKGYIDLEFRLGNIDRCRKLYEKYLEFMPENCGAWVRFAELESVLQEMERARAIFELAIGQPVLDMPELIWKAYIDLEIRLNEHDRVRALYTRLLQRTNNNEVKVWISRANFEGSINQIARARPVFEAAEAHFKAAHMKEQRAVLLEAWRDYELKYGDVKSIEAVAKRLPQKIKKKRQLKGDDGQELGWEEYYDYLFPDETDKSKNLKILEMARKWKKQKVDADAPAPAPAPAAAPAAPADDVAPAPATAAAPDSTQPTAAAAAAANADEIDI